MKKFSLVLVIIVLLAVYGCSGKSAYRIAIDFSRMTSRLGQKYQRIGGHLTVAYLDNEKSDKPVLILLHGFEAQKEHWLPLANALKGRYRLIIPDLIGDGESSKPMQINYSIEAQARRLHRFIRKLKLGQRVVMVGNSMGGAIAVEYAAHFPVKSLILLDPLGMEVERSALEKMGEAEFRKVFLDICKAQDVQRLMRTVFDDPPYVPGIVLDYMAREKCRFSKLDALKARYLYRDGHWIFNKTLGKQARRITVPTLILWGKDDQVLSYRNGEAFQKAIPHSRLILMDRAGHVPMIEKPKETARYFMKFLDKQQ